MPFRLNTPLFSDGALKRRFVYLPAGKAATYDATEAFDFPVGAALIKTFAFPADFRKPDKDVRLIETRVLLRQEAGWQAWAYLWNEEQTDATLKIAGAKVDIKTIDEAGTPLAFTYSVPNKNQCKGCHAFNGETRAARAEGAQSERRDGLWRRVGKPARALGRRRHAFWCAGSR